MGAHIICSRITVTVLLVLLILSLATSSVKADVEELRVEWQQFLPGVNGRSVVQTSDGGFLVLVKNATIDTNVYGRTEYVNTTYLLVKTDAEGNLVWTKNLPLNENESVSTIIETSDGGFALGGGRSVELPLDWGGGMIYHSTMGQLFMVKLDSSCNIEWSMFYPKNEGVEKEQDVGFKDLIQTSDGGFALAGRYFYRERIAHIWFAKTDSSGNLQWNKTIERVVDSDRAGGLSNIIQTSDGGYMIIGSSYIPGCGCTVEIVKIDDDGDTQWIREYPGLIYDNQPWAYCAISTNDGGYVIGGFINYDDIIEGFSIYDGQYAWLTKIDELGNPVWSRVYGEPLADVHSVAQTEDGYVFFAETDGIGAVFKVDSEGFLKDRINFESNTSSTVNYLNQIVVTDDGGYVLVGTWNESSHSSPGENEKSWLVKISSTVYPITDTVAPSVSFSSPQNKTYTQNSVSLAFTVNEETLWLGYSLDGQKNVTISKNTLELTGLREGLHNITVYAKDKSHNIGKSETVYFTIDLGNIPTVEVVSTIEVWSIPTTEIVLVAIVAATIVILILFRKRK